MRSLFAALVLVTFAACSSSDPSPDGGTECDPAQNCTLSPEAQTSKQINDVRNSVTAAIDLPIDGALITYVVPRSSAHPDAHGFFVQAEKNGPGLFIRVDPDAVNPAPERGDRVRFRVRNIRRDPGTRIEATEISNYQRLSQGEDVKGLVQDITREGRLLDTGWQFDGELVRLEGRLIHEWVAPISYVPLEPGLWFAAIEAKGGFSNSRFVVVVPGDIAQNMGDSSFCDFTLEAVPLRTGTNSVELWSFDQADFGSLKCSGAELQKALALGPDQVRLTFTRPIDPKTVAANGSAFTFEGGLTAKSASSDGRVVLLTTDPQQSRAEYTVKIGAEVKDSLGNSVTVKDGRDTFQGFFPRAKLVLNELFCNGNAGRDLVELQAIEPGSTFELTLTWEGASKPSLLATFPDTEVAKGDVIVVHLGTNPFKGDAVYPELKSKDEQPASTNYPGAWDFVYEDTQCDPSEGVMRVRDLNGKTMDGVALWNSGINPGKLDPLFASTWLRGLQLEGAWEPRSCGGQYCGVTTNPSLAGISVEQKGVRQLSNESYVTVARKVGPDGEPIDTNSREDWAAPGAGSLGRPNP